MAAGVYTLYNMRLEAKKQSESADAEKTVQLKTLEKYVLPTSCRHREAC